MQSSAHSAAAAAPSPPSSSPFVAAPHPHHALHSQPQQQQQQQQPQGGQTSFVGHAPAPQLPVGSHQIVTTTENGTVTHFVHASEVAEHQQQDTSPQPGAYPYTQRSSGSPFGSVHVHSHPHSPLDRRGPPGPVAVAVAAQPHHHQHHHQHHPHPPQQHPHFHHRPQFEQHARFYRNMSQYTTNPVGALQERFQSRGITPEYRVVQAEGASHCPTFSFQVTVQDIVAIGSGSSKKQAKHNAARAMLDKLDGRIPIQENVTPHLQPAPQPSADPMKSDTASQSSVSSTVRASASKVSNTIGQLQEFCVREGFPMPVYDLGSVEGQPHQRNFKMTVKVGMSICQGEGTSKKDAKRDAALKMIRKLQGDKNISTTEVTIPVTSPKKDDEDSDISTKAAQFGSEIADMKIESLNQEHLNNIRAFYNNFNESCSSNMLFDLHNTTLSGRKKGAIDYVKMLTDLATEQKFEVTFVQNEEHNDDEEVQTIVQLSSLPVAVCYGTGIDKESAEQDAAYCALNYLKMMTKEFAKGNTMRSVANGNTTNGINNGN